MSIQQGNYLKELRVKNGLSQEKLAERLGVSRQSVSKWEQGYAVPSSDNVLELSKLYGISADNILNCEVPQVAEDEKFQRLLWAKKFQNRKNRSRPKCSMMQLPKKSTKQKARKSIKSTVGCLPHILALPFL